MITDRDIRVLEWLSSDGNNFKVADTKTIANLFYPSLLVAQKRLKALYDDKQIKRFRDTITNQYCYYVRKLPINLRHSLINSQFVGELSKYTDVVYSQAEYTIENMRSDSLLGTEYKGRKFLIFTEVEISNNQFNMQKYIDLYNSKACQSVLGTFPLIVIISNKRTISKNILFKTIQIREDFSNIGDLLKALS